MNFPPIKEWPADAIERRAVTDLIPYARNSRTHSDAQVAQLAASIREWGFTTPVLVDEDDTILAGHGRVLAAQRLALDTIPVVVARGWSEAQKRAYVIADNKLALNAGWDMDLLKVELQDLTAAEFALETVGFSGAEIESFFPALADEEDFAPDTDEASTGADSLLLTFGRRRVPMSETEAEAIESLFAEYSEGNGTAYGFVAWMVERARS